MTELKLLEKLNEQCKQKLSEGYLRFDCYQGIKQMIINIEKETAQFMEKARALYATSNKLSKLNEQLTGYTQKLNKVMIQLQNYNKPPQGWVEWILKLIKRCYDLMLGSIKGVIYLFSIGYLNLFKEDQLQIIQRQIERIKTNIKGVKDQIEQVKNCHQIIRTQLEKFVKKKIPEYRQFMKQIQVFKQQQQNYQLLCQNTAKLSKRFKQLYQKNLYSYPFLRLYIWQFDKIVENRLFEEKINLHWRQNLQHLSTLINISVNNTL